MLVRRRRSRDRRAGCDLDALQLAAATPGSPGYQLALTRLTDNLGVVSVAEQDRAYQAAVRREHPADVR